MVTISFLVVIVTFLSFILSFFSICAVFSLYYLSSSKEFSMTSFKKIYLCWFCILFWRRSADPIVQTHCYFSFVESESTLGLTLSCASFLCFDLLFSTVKLICILHNRSKSLLRMRSGVAYCSYALHTAHTRIGYDSSVMQTEVH